MTSNFNLHSWRNATLGEVTQEVSERTGKTGQAIRIYGVERETGLTPTPKYVAKDVSRYKKIEPGMFAYNPMRLNIGSLGFCSLSHQPGAVSPDYVVFRCDSSLLDSLYMHYFTQSQHWQEWARGAGVGSVRVRIYYRELARMPIRLPPLEEQTAIASVLGSLDNKIEQNRRTGRALEGLARATFKAWFVDFEPVKVKAAGQKNFPGMPTATFAALPDCLTDSPLGPVPQGWKVGSLVDVAEVLSGGTPKTSVPDYWDGEIGWASAKDVSQCGETFLLSTERRITERGLKESATQLIPAFATVVVARGATTGRMTMFAQPLAMNQTCYALLCPTHPFFFNLLCANAMAAMVQAAHGSVFDTITKSTINSSRIVIPPPEQRDAFEEWVLPIFKLIHAGLAESRKLVALRDYLLPRLLSGEVRVLGQCE